MPLDLTQPLELNQEGFNDLYNKMNKEGKWLLIWTSLATQFARRLGGDSTAILNSVLSQYLIDNPPPDFFAWHLVVSTAAEKKPLFQSPFGPTEDCRDAADALADELGIPPIQWRN